MKVKVAKWGNSVAVRLPKRLADELGLVPGKELDLQQDGKRLTLDSAERPKFPVYRLKDLVAEMKKIAPEDRPKFEDWSAVEPPWPDDDWSDIAPTDEECDALKPQSQAKRGNG